MFATTLRNVAMRAGIHPCLSCRTLGVSIGNANTFNNRLQPTQLQATSPVPSTLLNLNYNYDQGSGHNNGSVVNITNGRDSNRTAAYTYDQLNRLASAQTTASTWGDSYVYDAWGNLLQKNVTKGTAESMTLTVNNKNQVTTPAFTYDAAGNVTWDTTNAMKYDAEGRMNPLSGVTYTYDGDGRRVQKSYGTLYWVDDAFRPLSVGTTSGITRDYIFVGGQRIAFVPLSSGNAYYYLSDHLGSDTVVASGDGKTIQWEGEFFPFGAQRTVITNLADNPYQFTGYEYDSGTGYNYAVARFDAGRWGRFLSPDPYQGSIDVTNPQSINRYSYVGNNPVNFVDLLGLNRTLVLVIGNCLVEETIGYVSGADEKAGNESLLSSNIIFCGGGSGGGSGGSGGSSGNSATPSDPCSSAANAPDPTVYQTRGHDAQSNEFKDIRNLYQFRRGGPLDAQIGRSSNGQRFGGSPAYANYVFGVYMSAAGYTLAQTLAGLISMHNSKAITLLVRRWLVLHILLRLKLML